MRWGASAWSRPRSARGERRGIVIDFIGYDDRLSTMRLSTEIVRSAWFPGGRPLENQAEDAVFRTGK